MTNDPAAGQSGDVQGRILKRFIFLMAILTVVMFTVWATVSFIKETVPGDYEVRQGDILLGDKKYDEALERFNAALKAQPDHRGALMGRALVYVQTGQNAEAEAELTYLIDFLTKTLESDDPTGIAVLGAAYANRGILRDRQGLHRKALDDYIEALKIDKEGMDGPGLINKLLYSEGKVSSVLDRARYLYEQFQKPESERLLSIPEVDQRQFIYKP